MVRVARRLGDGAHRFDVPDVTIPASATTAQLTFYLRVATAETTTTTAYDTFKVQLRDTANALLTQLTSLST